MVVTQLPREAKFKPRVGKVLLIVVLDFDSLTYSIVE